MSHQSRMGEALEIILLAQEDIEAWADADHAFDCLLGKTPCSSHILLKRISDFLEQDKTIQLEEVIAKLGRQESNRVDRILESFR